jgi:hypothetical protein
LQQIHCAAWLDDPIAREKIKETFLGYEQALLILLSISQGSTPILKPLGADMVNKDPSKRPTMDEVIVRFENIVKDEQG